LKLLTKRVDATKFDATKFDATKFDATPQLSLRERTRQREAAA